jgi:hypothetical protein
VINVVWKTPPTGWTFFHLLVRSHDTVGLLAAGKSQYTHTRPDLPRGTLPVLSGSWTVPGGEDAGPKPRPMILRLWALSSKENEKRQKGGAQC